jgi:hypothetical protein
MKKSILIALSALWLTLSADITCGAAEGLVTFPSPVQSSHRNARVNYDLNPQSERFYVWTPPDFSRSQTYGLIVYIAPVDATGIPQGWADVLAKRKFLFVAAQNSGNSTPPPRRSGLAVMAALEMMRDYKIDSRRVYVAGLSGGARTAASVAFWQPDIFSGTIQDCGSNFYRPVAVRYTTNGTDTNGNTYNVADGTSAEDASAARRAVKFCLITGSGDFRHGNVLDIYNGGFIADGFRAKLIDVPGMGHQDCSGQVLEQALDYLK